MLRQSQACIYTRAREPIPPNKKFFIALLPPFFNRILNLDIYISWKAQLYYEFQYDSPDLAAWWTFSPVYLFQSLLLFVL